MSATKPIICIDFDATIHSYGHGWQDGEIYGDVLPGFFAWYEVASKLFTVVIYSSRSKDITLRSAMADWLRMQYRRWRREQVDAAPFEAEFTFTDVKPPAFLTIDDSAIQFQGTWEDPALNPETLSNFKPWHKGGGKVNLQTDRKLQEQISSALYVAVKGLCGEWKDWPGTDELAKQVVKVLKLEQ